jgi:hypothetical protein
MCFEGDLYGPLHDPFVFSRVALDSEVGTVLHDWPANKAAFAAAAKRWKSQPTARVAEKPE